MQSKFSLHGAAKCFVFAVLLYSVFVAVLSPSAFPQNRKSHIATEGRKAQTVQSQIRQASVDSNATKMEQSQNASGVDKESDLLKARAESKQTENDSIKIVDSRHQYYFDLAYRLLLLVAGIFLLIWLIPQIQSFSIPFGGGILSISKAPKEPAVRPVSTIGTSATTLHLTEAVQDLKKVAMPNFLESPVFGKLDEIETYQKLDVAKDSIYLCHKVRGSFRREYYRILIYLDADDPSILDKVEKVVYKLHPTFTKSEITISDRKSQFQLEISAWGEFMLSGEVYFKNINKPIILKRYLNF
jgi:hypothetical protein